MSRRPKPNLHHSGWWRCTHRGQSIWAKTEADCWAKLAAAESQASVGPARRTPPRPATVAELIASYRRINPGRWQADMLAYFAHFAGPDRLAAIKPDTILTTFARRMQSSYAAQTIRHAVNYAHAALIYAYDQHWLDRPPRKPRLPKLVPNPAPIVRDDLRRIVDRLQSVPGRQRAHDLVSFRLETGARPGEVCALCWSMFDPDAGRYGVFRLSAHKTAHTTGQLRTIYLTRRARELIDCQPRFNAHVFNSRRRRPYTVAGLRSTWTRAVREALGDAARIAQYRLRHTFAQTARRRDIAPDVLKTLMGHRSLGTTLRYYQIEDSSAIAAVDSLSQPWPASPARAPRRPKSARPRSRPPAPASDRSASRSKRRKRASVKRS